MRRIPFFLPMTSCPGRCVYCDQKRITGITGIPTPGNVRETLSSLDGPVEVCFFGGSFTCMPPDTQREYLDAAMAAPAGTTVRFSTHPGCVTDDRLAFVVPYPISMVELGISSLDDGVLSACGRGYGGNDALSAVSRLLDSGFGTGVQLMVGLPRQTLESSLEDLRLLAAVKGPRDMALRIYPTLVLPGTDLDDLYRTGAYDPLNLTRAIEWTAAMALSAIDLGFSLQRVGLAETESLKASRPKGPYHPAFGEFVWAESLSTLFARNSATGPWAVSERAFSILHSHAAFGVRKLAEKTGCFPDLVRSRFRFLDGDSRIHRKEA